MTRPAPEGEVAGGLRRALLGLAALTALGLLGELLLIGHTEEALQGVPLVLAGLALVAAAALAGRPSPRLLTAVRALGLALALGAALGSWEHLEGNLAFEDELRPNTRGLARVRGALFGANPLLAPGALAATGGMLLAAAWRHPVGARSEP